MPEEQVQQPAASVETLPEDRPLGDYRASREGNALKRSVEHESPKPLATPVKEPAPSPSPAPGAPVVDSIEDEAAAADGGTPEQQTERKKKLGGFQKTIARQTDRITELERQLATAKPPEPGAPAAAAAAPPAPAAGEPVYAAPKPLLENFATLSEHVEALADWTADRRDWLKEQRTAAAARAQAVTKLTDNWKAKTVEFKAEHEDYDAVLAGVADVKLPAAHQHIFLDSENGVALAYHLAQDPEELKRIAALSPMQAAMTLGKLEAVLFPKVVSEEDPEPKVSAAPRPFKPVSGFGARVTPNPATLSAADYRKGRETGRIA